MRDRKNWVMSKATVLVYKLLTQPDQIRWVNTTPASVDNLCLSLPSWYGWTKLLEINKNYNYSPIICSNSLPVVLSKTIGWNNLVELYNILFGLEMITVVNILKWDSQCPRLMQVLVMLISFLMHSLFLTIVLRCLQDNLSGPEVKELLYLLMVSISLAFKKGGQLVISLSRISSKRLVLIC